MACGLILLPSVLFWIAISCKTVKSSMKFKFIHKIFVIQGFKEKFLVFFNLLRGPDIKRSGAGSGQRAVGCASLMYTVKIRSASSLSS